MRLTGILTRQTTAYAISLSISCVCLHANEDILKGRASAAYEWAMTDFESMTDATWHSLLLDVLVQYVTLLTNPEGPAPSAPTLTRPEIIERDNARKEARAASAASAAAAADSSGDSCGSGGGGGDDDGDGDDATSEHGDEAAQPAAAKAAGGAARGRQPAAGPGERTRGTRKDEPFVCLLFPWLNCHGGAWNQAILITNTSLSVLID